MKTDKKIAAAVLVTFKIHRLYPATHTIHSNLDVPLTVNKGSRNMSASIIRAKINKQLRFLPGFGIRGSGGYDFDFE